MDTQASFTNSPPKKKEKEVEIKNKEGSDAEPEAPKPQSKVDLLIEKLVERQKEIDAQRAALLEVYSQTSSEVEGLEGTRALGEELHDLFGQA